MTIKDKLVEIVSVITIITAIAAVGFWINDTFATKTDVMINFTELRIGQVQSDLWAMERAGIENMAPAEIRRYEVLKFSEVDLVKKRRKILGLD